MNTKHKIIGIVSSVLLVISVWLPYVTALGYGTNLLDVPKTKFLGISIIISGILCTAFVTMDKKATKILSIVIASLFLLITGSVIVAIIAEPRKGTSIGMGAILMPLACIGIIVSAIIGLSKKKTNTLV